MTQRAMRTEMSRGEKLMLGACVGLLVLGSCATVPHLLAWATLALERSQGVELYDPNLGGDPMRAQLGGAERPFPVGGCVAITFGVVGMALVFASTARRRRGRTPSPRENGEPNA